MKPRPPHIVTFELIDNLVKLTGSGSLTLNSCSQAKQETVIRARFNETMVELAFNVLMDNQVLQNESSNTIRWNIDYNQLNKKSLKEILTNQVSYRNYIFNDVGELAFGNISKYENDKWKLISEEYDIDEETRIYFDHSDQLMYQYWTSNDEIHLASNYQKHRRAIKIKKGLIKEFKFEVSEPGQESGWISLATISDNTRGAILNGKTQEESKSDFRNKIFKLETTIIPSLIQEFEGKIKETKKYW